MSFSWLSEENKSAPAASSSSSSSSSKPQQQQQQIMNNSAPPQQDTASYLRFASVDQVSNFRGSDELASALKELQFYSQQTPSSNVMLKTDPEYQFILNCGNLCVKIEYEKLKIHRFIVDHYARRFPELSVLVQDATTFARVVAILGNNIDEMDQVMEKLEDLIPSQLLAAVIAATTTTRGAILPDGDMENILEACNELTSLEEVKQVLLEYIQEKMIFLCRNLCAFMGSGIASQLVATAGSVDALAEMTNEEVAALGSQRAQKVGFAVKTAGFLHNVDLVAKQPPELRTKAMRLVSDQVVQLARIDAKREGADESKGLAARDYVIRKILEWTDPLIQEERKKKYGLSNKLYEKRTRLNQKDRWAKAAANTTSYGGQRRERE
jgi:U4/U6 small nuclear ribonucleoprotein PRP31